MQQQQQQQQQACLSVSLSLSDRSSRKQLAPTQPPREPVVSNARRPLRHFDWPAATQTRVRPAGRVASGQSDGLQLVSGHTGQRLRAEILIITYWRWRRRRRSGVSWRELELQASEWPARLPFYSCTFRAHLPADTPLDQMFQLSIVQLAL